MFGVIWFSDLFNTEKIYNKASLEKCIAWGGKEGLLKLLKTSENARSFFKHNRMGFMLMIRSYWMRG